MDPVWKESSAWRDTEYAGGEGRGWGAELQTVFEGLRQSSFFFPFFSSFFFFPFFFFFLWCILFCPI